jgi:hypothetical protein
MAHTKNQLIIIVSERLLEVLECLATIPGKREAQSDAADGICKYLMK